MILIGDEAPTGCSGWVAPAFEPLPQHSALACRLCIRRLCSFAGEDVAIHLKLRDSHTTIWAILQLLRDFGLAAFLVDRQRMGEKLAPTEVTKHFPRRHT